jgi:hypothetical protein
MIIIIIINIYIYIQYVLDHFDAAVLHASIPWFL